MGRYQQVAQKFLTGLVLVAILTTTFLTDWVAPAQAAPTDPTVNDAGTTPEAYPVASSGADISADANLRPPDRVIPMNALVLGESDQIEALQAAITEAGDTVHIRQGDALFVGLENLDERALTAFGARALYREQVSDEALAGLSDSDRDAALIWNTITSGASGANAVLASDAAASTSVFLTTDTPLVNGSTTALYLPTDTQTSMFLYGKVGVKVLFVESNGSAENWTEIEVNKVKTEIVRALDWWTMAATVPDEPGEPARPSAQLVWNVSYVSPFEGTTADKAKIQVGTEPIQSGLFTAAADTTGWIPQIAAAFTGLPANASAVRKLADTTRDSTSSDWGFVLFVVDSSSDTDGFFNTDMKMAGAALNGPWAVVSYDAGDLGTENLEVVIAKMVGHVFGAGDEGHTLSEGGCSNEEIYGYLRVAHANCAQDNPDPESSLMLYAPEMGEAYQEFQLSESARAQVGWRDNDEDGIYDVIDTLVDTFGGVTNPVCPTLHLAAINISNNPALPDGISDPVGAQWGVHVWNPMANNGQGAFNDINLYTPVNINRPSFVWGRINGEEWLEGSASDGAWGEEFEAYTLLLPGNAGAINQVEVAIMDRWAQTGYISPTPTLVTVAPPVSANGTYQSNDTTKVNLFTSAGVTGGWTTSVVNAGYSGTTTQLASGAGSEACFAVSVADGGFASSAVKILYSRETDNKTANVLVDGELHSTIVYTNTGQKQAEHYIANLSPGAHTIQIVAQNASVDFDAFVVMNDLSALMIDATNAADIPADKNGFYEQTGAKLLYVGSWSNVTLDTTKRPAPGDNAGRRSTHAYDRIYAFFTHASVAGIYRGVFPGGGTAYVYVDGEYRGYMNNDAKVTAVMPFYVGGLDPSAVHVIEVRMNSDAPRFDFDALRLFSPSGAQLYAPAVGETFNVAYSNPTNADHESYGVWEYKATGTYVQANDEGDLKNVFFQGSAVAVLVRTATDTGGVMELYADGALVRTVNLKVAATSEAPIVLHGFDPTVPHTLQVRHHNINPAAPKWTRIDGYRVYHIQPVGAGEYEEYQYSGNTPTQSVFIYEQVWKFPAAVTANPGPSSDRYIQSGYLDARAYLYFEGVDTITLYAVARDTYGTMEMWVDGQLKGTFNLYSASVKYNIPYTITGMDPTREHVLELRIKNQSKIISIDRVVLYNRPVLGLGTYQNDGLVDIGGGVMVPAVQMSGQWKRVSNASAGGGNYDMVSNIEDKVVFSVTNATSVMFYRRLFSTYGRADVYVDNKYYTSFDNYVASPTAGVFQEPFIISDLDPNFNHEIRVVPQRFGTGNTQYKPFDFDYIVVRSGDAAGAAYLTPSATEYQNDNLTAVNGGAITYVGSSWTSGATSRANIVGNKVVVLFEGNTFTIYFNKASNGGKANITIDGKLVGSFSSLGSATHVPYTVSGLDPTKRHTAEINLATATTMYIDSFLVQELTPASGPTTFDLAPLDTRVRTSEEWYVENGYLKSTKLDARLVFYVTGGDTLFITHESWTGANSIQVYVNGVLHSTLDSAYLRQAPKPEAEYIVTGLLGMLTQGYWIEIRNPAAVKISLKEIRVGTMTPGLTDGQTVEAEGTTIVRRMGLWAKRPDTANATNYSGGYFLQSTNIYSAFYIPTEGLSYVTVYRPTGLYGNANVYIDGKYWGIMPNNSAVAMYKVPFTIGPIPDTPGIHVVEIRPATTVKIPLDKIVGHGLNMLQPGAYENDDARLIYSGSWTNITAAQASGGSMKRSTAKGSRVTATFMGNELSIIFGTSSYGNFMRAYVDGIGYPIYTKSATAAYKVKHTILLTNNGPHSLELFNEGSRLDFDALDIRTRAPAQYGAYQHDSPQVVLNRTGLWTTQNAVDHSAGSYVSSTTKYASAFFLFYGQRVTVYMTTGKTWDKITFYLDGKLYQKVTLFVKNQANIPYYAFDITGLTADNHVLEIRHEGEDVNADSKRQINFDVITVGGAAAPKPGDVIGGPGPDVPRYGCYEEDSADWTFSGPDNAWALQTAAGASGDQYYQADVWPDTYAEFLFSAEGFSLIYHKGPAGGHAQVFVDGLYVTTLNMFSATDQWLSPNALYTVNGLNPNVLHMVKIVQAGGGFIYLDRLDLPMYNSSYNDSCSN